MKILAIDDDKSVLGLLEQILTLPGTHEVATARSAKEALEQIGDTDRPFDCFLIDIQMPEIDGIVLTKLIRQTPGQEKTPIIMLTAMEQKHYLDRAFAAGATDYVTKPFDFMALQARLQQAQKLTRNKELRENRPTQAGEFKGMGEDQKDIRLDQPISLPGIEAAIDYCEFENYLREISQRQLSKITTVAVELVEVKKIYADSSSEAFVSLINHIAQAAQETLLAEGGTLSYRGNGTFLCANEKRLKGPRRDLEAALNKRFAELHPQARGTVARLAVGEQFKVNTASAANTLESLSAAIEDVRGKATNMRDVLEAPRRLLKKNQLCDEQKHLEQRAYQALLNDALSDQTNDRWNRKLLQRRKRKDGLKLSVSH